MNHSGSFTRPKRRQRAADPGMPAPVSSQSVMRRWTLPAALFALVILAYIPALYGMWLWDDKYSVGSNVFLRDREGLWSIWTSFGKLPGEEHYWPVTYTVLWAGWQIWGASVVGFHFLNFALHGLIVVQVWRLCRRIGMRGGAIIAAALFALHPVHVEAVAWIISIKDLIATLLYLAAIECCIVFRDGRRARWLALGCVAAALAMLSKSSPLMLPAGLALLVWYRYGTLKGRDWAVVALMGAVTFSFACLDTWLRINFKVIGAHDPPLAARLVQSAHAFWFYIQKLVMPFGLSPIYPKFAIDSGRALDWMPWAAIILATAGLWFARGKIGRGPLACWLFYGITLGPALGVVYFGFLSRTPVADRYQYLAGIGPIAGMGALAGAWIEKHASRRAWAVAPVAVIMMFCFVLTFRQAGYYRDEGTLFSHARSIAPESGFVYFNLGNAYMEQNRCADAEKMFAEAVRIDPEDWMSVCNMGGALIAQNKIADAVELFSNAIDRGCTTPAMFCNAASIMATSHDPSVYNPARALHIANRLIELRGRSDANHVSILAMAQAANGNFTEAIANAQQALILARQQDQTELIQKLPVMIRMYRRGEK